MEMADSQKKGRGSSGGQRIDDHSFWAGGKSKESPLPMNSKMKQYNSAESSGSEMDYEDTTEKIKSQQNMGVGKAKAYPQKPLHRN
jgi:hypothetical protein